MGENPKREEFLCPLACVEAEVEFVEIQMTLEVVLFIVTFNMSEEHIWKQDG
jgi:hypothetical protein